MEANSKESRKALVQSGISKEAVPIDQAVVGSDGGRGSVNLRVKLFKYILSRPLIIFGVMYYIKMGLRYLAELKEGNNGIDTQKEL